MPNWIEGTMKLRGKPEDIKSFIRGSLKKISFCRKETEETSDDANAIAIIEEYDDGSFECTINEEAYVAGTRRAFVQPGYVYLNGKEEVTATFVIRQAWSFTSTDKDAEVWGEISEKYNVDIKLFGIECGMQFCEEVVVLRKQKKIIENVIQYEDWDWECPFPHMGG